MDIQQIRVQNYKSFLDSGEVKINGSLFALIGQNNTGKSAIMDAIQCVFPSSKKTVTPTDYHKGSTSDIIIEIWFTNVTGEYLEDKIYADKVKKQIDKVNKLETELGSDATEAKKNKVIDEKAKIEHVRQENYKSCLDKYKVEDDEFYIKLVAKKGSNITKKFYLNNEEEIKEADLKILLPELKVIPAIRDPKNESTAGTNSYLKELIQMLDDEIQTNIEITGNNISYKELNKVIADETKERCKSLGKDITSFYNHAIGTNDYEVIIDSDVNISKGTTYTTKIKDKNTGVESDILSCGTGYQSMIILSILETYVKISQKNSSYILLIEEPEVYLHPTLQRKMIDTLITISDSNQVLFTSHSPITVSKLASSQIKLVKKIEGVAIIEDIDPNIVIEELGIKADDILVNKGIIFVEGKDDKAVIELLLNKIEEGLSNKINIIDAGNCENLKFYANAEILINNKFTIPTLIIRDTDTKEPSKRKQELFNDIKKVRNNPLSEEIQDRINESIVVLEGYSLEGYFIDRLLLENIGLLEEEVEKAISCYECQYSYYAEKVYAGHEDIKTLSSWYQPKYFLEKFLDKFKASNIEHIEQHNERYKVQWRKYVGCQACTKSNIEDFFEYREKINQHTLDLKKQRKDFMIEAIQSKNIVELKETKLRGIIEQIERFKDKIE